MSGAPSLHELATHFGSAADAYERGRPEHPPEVVGRLRAELGLGDGATVLDLGAGTGKLTKGLVEAGLDVVAVEPLDAMRALLAERVPGANVLAGQAERIPLPDGSVAAVTVADAFHWFDARPALAEIRRVLRPEAGLATLNALPDWNRLEVGNAIAAHIHSTRPEHPYFDGPSFAERVRAASGWEEPRETVVSVVRPAGAEGIVAYLASISFVAGMPEGDRTAWLAEVADLLEGTEVPAALPFDFRIGITRTVGR